MIGLPRFGATARWIVIGCAAILVFNVAAGLLWLLRLNIGEMASYASRVAITFLAAYMAAAQDGAVASGVKTGLGILLIYWLVDIAEWLVLGPDILARARESIGAPLMAVLLVLTAIGFMGFGPVVGAVAGWTATRRGSDGQPGA